MTLEIISWSISKKNVADLGGGWTRDLLVSSQTKHPIQPPRLAILLYSPTETTQKV